MITQDQFEFYKTFAHRVFDYISPKILNYIKCYLQVDVADMVNYTFANLRRPNIIYLHLDNIVIECGNGYNKNKVCSMIIICITHELFHVEQIMSQEDYRNNPASQILVEKSVNAKSYGWLLANKDLINRVFGLDLDLGYLHEMLSYEDQNIYDQWMKMYYQCNVEQMYKYTIMNVVFRNQKNYDKFKRDILDKYENIVIAFENGANFLIKSNNEFCGSVLNNFISMVGETMGKYDRYTVNVNMVESPYRDKSYVAYVTFTLSNRTIIPMIFRDND